MVSLLGERGTTRYLAWKVEAAAAEPTAPMLMGFSSSPRREGIAKGWYLPHRKSIIYKKYK
jgi:hypothetical protein